MFGGLGAQAAGEIGGRLGGGSGWGAGLLGFYGFRYYGLRF